MEDAFHLIDQSGDSMHAAQITRFGDWQSVEVADAPIPEPRAGEVLVRVAASSVNSVDAAHREGRLTFLAGRRIPQGLGIDMVGTVQLSGAAVTGFSSGERVWGIRSSASGMKSATGLTAEYAVIDARQLARAPGSLDDVEAAGLVIGGYTALRALKDVAKLQPGERVLIRGGSGGVGSAGVQIAAALGADVAVLASASSEEFVRNLGATEFFDYSTATPASVGRVNVLLDTVGTDLPAWRRTLTPDGRMVGVAFDSLAGIASIGMSVAFGSRRIRTFAGQPPEGALEDLTQFVADNRIRGVVHETYPLSQSAEAHRRFSARGVRGKIVITIGDSPDSE